MDIKILFEDEYLMVIDKPSGVVVNRVETMEAKTVADWLENNFQNLRAGIVHRLDKETSGCLIIAKTPEAFTELQRQFKSREVKKEYLALVHGLVEPKEGTIKVPLVRSHHDRDRFTVSAGGRISETGYEVLRIFKGLAFVAKGQALSELSLLRVFPKTGRTHQIRVHFKYFGHPLVSDEKYGGKKAPEDRKWCPRIFLHAAKIEFCHPVKKNKVSVVCDLPADLNGVLRNLKPLT
ncbi:RluA family pseudouridine synthase [Candidatus Collierbacteria bacterium]|nr:RluA family pseudouridine synthase [Candidatus Collierbacteria bacterium]